MSKEVWIIGNCNMSILWCKKDEANHDVFKCQKYDVERDKLNKELKFY